MNKNFKKLFFLNFVFNQTLSIFKFFIKIPYDSKLFLQIQLGSVGVNRNKFVKLDFLRNF